MALMGEWHEPANGVQYFLSNTARREQVVRRNKFPNVSDVLRCEWMKIKTLLLRSSRRVLLE